MTIEGQYAGFTLELRDPGIACIRFAREAGTYNGFTAAMKRDLTDLVYELNIRPDTRILLFMGSNGAFCGGDDVKSYYDDRHWEQARGRNLATERRLDELGLYDRLRFGSQKLTTAIHELDLITIAAIDGVCIQSALTLALACDFRIASTAARIGSATLRFGFMPDENGHYMLVRQLGVSKALEFLFDNRILSGEEALDWGLVNAVVSPEALEERAMAMATRYAQGPQVAMRMLKRALYRAAETDFQAAADDIALRTAITDHNPDAAEGVAAWVEKRKPVFNQGEKAHAQVYKPGQGVVSD
jgi:2-(1,2-epoxy-1,2-dihydrophenyl)acetyl-CoA isomerase